MNVYKPHGFDSVGMISPSLSLEQHKYMCIVFSYTVWRELKVHKIENFFGSEFEFYTISLLVMLKY